MTTPSGIALAENEVFDEMNRVHDQMSQWNLSNTDWNSDSTRIKDTIWGNDSRWLSNKPDINSPL